MYVCLALICTTWMPQSRVSLHNLTPNQLMRWMRWSRRISHRFPPTRQHLPHPAATEGRFRMMTFMMPSCIKICIYRLCKLNKLRWCNSCNNSNNINRTTGHDMIRQSRAWLRAWAVFPREWRISMISSAMLAYRVSKDVAEPARALEDVRGVDGISFSFFFSV